jgi:hypothetical protein
MRRRLTTLLAMVVVMVMLGAAPALANKGGVPHEGNCGIGATTAHGDIADQTSPGATESARVPPSEAGCTGQG